MTRYEEDMINRISNKLGFDVVNPPKEDYSDAHEADNVIDPYEALDIEDLMFIREHNYFKDGTCEAEISL